ncbi:amino acid adenylation domain-containing protein [Pedobacter heparinus]|uniref:non-ribosomal peptide synthetase n=1 Tax=Pedobacter heparinus TaxID=984 RepID=UPI00292F58D2|nr:amino acid adenylation domain-containing protein [Pedobacter heparinus]
MHNNYNLVAVDFDPFEGNEIEKVVITNEPQREVWLSCILGGNEASLAYNESVSLELTGKFDERAFQQALHGLVGHHEGLRAVLSKNGEDLIIYKEISFDIYRSDSLSDLEHVTQQHALKTFINEEMGKPFDLNNGPLFRFYVHKLSENLHYFTIIIHHLIGDGWSLGIILEDLSLFYNAHLSGQKPDLPHAEQISDYAAQQTAFGQGEEYQLTNDFWLDQYKDIVPVLNLPLDFNRPAIRTYKGKRNDYVLDEELLVHIRQLSAKTGSSLVVTLITVFEVLLYHRTGQTDLVIGLPAAGQLATENLRLVGHCVNLLPLLSNIDPDQSFISYLIKRRSEIYDAYDHQRLTFSELIRKLNLKRDKALIPLVPVVFNVDMGMDEKVRFEGLAHQLISNPRVSQTFEISLNVNGSKNSLVFEWAYNTQLFTSATIDGMMQEFESLLRTVTSTPNVLIKDAIIHQSPFPEIAIHHCDYPKDSTFLELFAEQVVKGPDQTVAVFEGKRLTYLELDTKANQLANYLISKGIKNGMLVPVCISPSVEMLVGILGILKTGAAYLPVDVEFPARRIEYMLSESESDVIISDTQTSESLAKITEKKILCLDNPEINVWKESVKNPEVAISPTDLLYVIYTSGSTGNPKGVMIPHGALVDYLFGLKGTLPVLNSCKRFALGSTIATDLGNTILYSALILGAELHIFSKNNFNDADYVHDYFNRENIDCLKIVPSQWKFLIQSNRALLPEKLLIFGGELLPGEFIKEIRESKAKCAVVNHYGPTETTIGKLLHKVDKSLNYPASVPIGKPFSNTSVLVLNQHMKSCPVGIPGELYIGGAGIARGYLNNLALTDKVFVKDPLKLRDDIRFYKTGDLVRWLADGNIEYIGRIDDQIKIRGNRIELGEIQNVLQKYKEVKQCAITVEDHPTAGKMLAAYIVSEQQFNKEQIVAYLRNHLPEYMIPRLMMRIDQIPLTQNGKLDKRALPKIESLIEFERKEFIKPQTKEQELVARIWTENLSLNEVSITDNFFELGGHSLIAVKVMTTIEKETGKRLPLAALFENPTIEGLAKMLVADEDEIKWDSLVPIKRTGSKTPVYLIHGGGLNVLVFNPLGKYMDQDQPVYGMQALGLDGKTEFRYNMEDLADRYNTEILNNDPIGPYCLVGYSFGGLLAFEMAKKLIAAGKDVKMLGILDTYAGGKDKSHTRWYKIYKKVFRQLYKVLFFGKMLLSNPKETHSYQVLVLKRKIKNFFNKKPLTQEETQSYLDEIEHAYDMASHNYFMQPLAIEVDLFRVKKRLYFLDDPVSLGWKEYAKKGVNIHEVPGDHKTFLFPPYDKEFAEILQKALDNKN